MLNTHRETDLLGMTRAKKKADYWLSVVNGEIPLVGEITIEYAKERFDYWAGQIQKYQLRIKEHIDDFKQIENPLDFVTWISGIVKTIQQLLKLFF